MYDTILNCNSLEFHDKCDSFQEGIKIKVLQDRDISLNKIWKR